MEKIKEHESCEKRRVPEESKQAVEKKREERAQCIRINKKRIKSKFYSLTTAPPSK